MLKMSYLINYLVEVQVPMLSKLSYFPTERERESVQREEGGKGTEDARGLKRSRICARHLFILGCCFKSSMKALKWAMWSIPSKSSDNIIIITS